MNPENAKLTGWAVRAGGMLFGAANVEAGGYYYRARSFYMTPPIYANLPVFGQPPIVIYEPIVTYPAPVAGNYAPLTMPPPPSPPPAPDEAPPTPIRDRQIPPPLGSRYR